MWSALRDHVRHGLPPFSDNEWWKPIVSMVTHKPLISLHVSEVSITVSVKYDIIILQLLAVCGYYDNSYWEWLVMRLPKGPYKELLCHFTFLIMCKNKVLSILYHVN